MFTRRSSIRKQDFPPPMPLTKRNSLMCLPQNHEIIRTSLTPPVRSKYLKQPRTKSLESIVVEEEISEEFSLTESQTSLDFSSVKSWSESFNKLLEDPRGVKNFLLYLETEHSAENIRFWIECEKYKKASPADLKDKAKKIFKEYLCRNGRSQINIDASRFKEIKENIDQPNVWTLEKVQHDIFLLMKRDSYPRFLKSSAYNQLLDSS